MYMRTITRFLPPEEAVKSRGLFDNRAEELEFVSSVPMGGAYVLLRCWVLPGSTSDMKTVEMVKRDLMPSGTPSHYV